MKTSGAGKHIDGNHEFNCPRCESNQVTLGTVGLRAHENGNTVEIDMLCTVCVDRFRLSLSDGPNLSVRAFIETDE